jgi:hypothetical protein
MKKYHAWALLILCLPMSAWSRTGKLPTEFLGCFWGNTEEECDQILSAQNISYSSDTSTEDATFNQPILVVNKDSATITLRFEYDKLTSVEYDYNDTSLNWDLVLKHFEKKYGEYSGTYSEQGNGDASDTTYVTYQWEDNHTKAEYSETQVSGMVMAGQMEYKCKCKEILRKDLAKDAEIEQEQNRQDEEKINGM